MESPELVAMTYIVADPAKTNNRPDRGGGVRPGYFFCRERGGVRNTLGAGDQLHSRFQPNTLYIFLK
jgi:hypothetical protein